MVFNWRFTKPNELDLFFFSYTETKYTIPSTEVPLQENASILATH